MHAASDQLQILKDRACFTIIAAAAALVPPTSSATVSSAERQAGRGDVADTCQGTYEHAYGRHDAVWHATVAVG